MLHSKRSTSGISFCGVWVLIIGLAPLSSAAPIIENGGQPAHGRQVIQLEEQWRIGGLDDEDNLLGLIRNIVTDDQGNLYLLDTQLVEVLVFDPEGQYLKSLGREGEGPGELRRPRDLALLPDGTLGLIQGFPGKIIKVDLNGLPAGEMHPGGDSSEGGIFALNKVMVSGSHLVMAGVKIKRDERERTAHFSIASYDSASIPIAEYYSKANVRKLESNRRDETSRFFPYSWTLSNDGRVWIPPFRNEYRIDVYLADGTLQQTITRQYISYRRSKDEREQKRRNMTPWGGHNAQRSWNIVVEPTTPDIRQMHGDESGRLWVLSSQGAHPSEPGIHSVWDIFDTEGRFDQQVALKCEGRAIEDGIIFPGHGLVVVIKELLNAELAFSGRNEAADPEADKALPLEVICYKMPS